MKTKVLPPIKERPEDFDAIEFYLQRLFKTQIYLPVMREVTPIGANAILKEPVKNSTDDLVEAIISGKIRFNRGKFSGRFGASITKELRKIGAEWDRRQGMFLVPHSKLPIEIKQAIAVGDDRFQKTVERVVKRISEISPVEVAEKFKGQPLFDSALWKTEREFKKTVKGITVAPDLTPHQARRISTEYTKNLQLYIADWVQSETEELRKNIVERSLAGQRYEGVVSEIQRSYGVSQRKAKFLARQETSLMMTKFKQTRYQDAGVNEYIWGCVAGSTEHPVRPMHKVLQGKTFSWDDPPIVNDKGERKNPGQDYNCRCFAKPIVRF